MITPTFHIESNPFFSGCRQSGARPVAVVHQQVNPSPGQRRRRHPGVNVINRIVKNVLGFSILYLQLSMLLTSLTDKY